MRKSNKKIIAFCLMIIMLLTSFIVPIGAVDADSISVFSVCGYGSDESSAVKWWKSAVDGKYYMFLPSDSELDSVTTYFEATGDVYVGEEKLTSGEATTAFAHGGENTLTCGSASYSVVFMQSANIPAIYIETESGTLDNVYANKDYKEAATISVYEGAEKTIDAELDYIKGRGNSTWNLPKKPFNIKFSKKTDLFGLGKAKKWSLLAFGDENTLMRNKYAYNLADDVGLDYSSLTEHIDLYVNGEYLGIYLVCESVEIGSTRVDITELEKLNEDANPDIDIEECALSGYRTDTSGYVASQKKWVDIPNDPEDITGGYLLEFELQYRYQNEVSGFVSDNGQPVVLKSPEYASKAEVDYISGFYQEFEDALLSKDGYNSLGKHYSDYIDVESFVKMYIFEEFTEDVDSGKTSFFIYKDTDSDKMVASPVWDYDIALGRDFTRFGINLSTTDSWWAINNFYDDTRKLPSGQSNIPSFLTILGELCRHEDFMTLVRNEWRTSFSKQLTDSRTADILTFSQSLYPSATMNAVRWNIWGSTDYNTNLENYKNEVNSLVTYVTDRKAFLAKALSAQCSIISYDANGGAGVVYDSNLYSINDIVTVKSNAFVATGTKTDFMGWNTKPDGSGKAYQNGDYIRLTKANMVLYAQWRDPMNLIEKLINFLKTFYKHIQNWFRSISGNIDVDDPVDVPEDPVEPATTKPIAIDDTTYSADTN